MVTEEQGFLFELMLDCGIYHHMSEDGGRHTNIEKEKFRRDITSRLENVKNKHPNYREKLKKSFSYETAKDISRIIGEILYSPQKNF